MGSPRPRAGAPITTTTTVVTTAGPLITAAQTRSLPVWLVRHGDAHLLLMRLPRKGALGPLYPDSRHADYWIIALCFGSTVAKCGWLSARQSRPPYKTRAGNYRYAHRFVPLIRGPRRARGTRWKPSPSLRIWSRSARGPASSAPAGRAWLPPARRPSRW